MRGLARPIYCDDQKLDTAVMRETLRLAPTAPIRQTAALEDTTIGGGKYTIKKGTPILIVKWELHRDPAVWGNNVGALYLEVQPTDWHSTKGGRVYSGKDAGWEV